MASTSNRPAALRAAASRGAARLPWRRAVVFALASLALHAWLLRDAARLGVGAPASRGIEVVGVTILPGATQPAAPQARSLPAPASPSEAARPPRPGAPRPARASRPTAITPAPAPQVPTPASPDASEPLIAMAAAQPSNEPSVDPSDASAEGGRAGGALADRSDAGAAAAGGEAARPPATEGGDPRKDLAADEAVARAVADADAVLPGAPALPPPPAQAVWRYRVYSGDYLEDRQIASMDYRFSHDGRRYRFELAGRAEGLTAWLYSGALVQVSEGTIGGAGLQPERYAEQRGKRTERVMAVDRARRELVRGDDPRLPVPAGAQDRLSTLVQLGLLARAMPDRMAAGAVLELPELSFSGVETVRYRSAGRVVLTLPGGGEMPALHLVRERGASDREPGVEVWLGYDHALLPVRIRLTDAGGRVLDQFLQGS